MAKFKKGQYKPIHPKKYKGNLDNIIYRSSWELQYMKWCDNNKHVLQWSSEELVIPYKNPLDGAKKRVRRYYPDFWLKVRTKSGIEEWVVEIKPYKQTQAPKKQKRQTRRYINEVATYAVNSHKWAYAEAWCKSRGYKFVIITEKELNR